MTRFYHPLSFVSSLARSSSSFSFFTPPILPSSQRQTVLKKFDMASAEVDEIFKAIDVDGSGKIGYTEFLAATVEAKGHITEEQLLEAFDRLDADDRCFLFGVCLFFCCREPYKPQRKG